MFVSDIRQVSPLEHELAVAVPIHYAIGITLGFLYVFATSALGLSARGPKGTGLFLSRPVTHCFYGVGLWLGGLILR